MQDDFLKIDNKNFSSRLIVGSGKYPSIDMAIKSIEKSRVEMITVSIRRFQSKNNLTQEQSLINSIDWEKILLLPNTAGAKTAEEAIRMAFISREFTNQINQPNNSFIKLEVIPDPKYLLPDPLGTIKAARYLIKNGFKVLPYINADPILALHLEDVGCSTIMPLGSPIGSGLGLQNLQNIKIIKEYVNIPVIIDAGIRTPSEISKTLELGIDGVLVNTGIAKANDPILMAEAMCLAAKAGRLSYKAGLMQQAQQAQPSSPVKGLFL